MHQWSNASLVTHTFLAVIKPAFTQPKMAINWPLNSTDLNANLVCSIWGALQHLVTWIILTVLVVPMNCWDVEIWQYLTNLLAVCIGWSSFSVATKSEELLCIFTENHWFKMLVYHLTRIYGVLKILLLKLKCQSPDDPMSPDQKPQDWDQIQAYDSEEWG